MTWDDGDVRELIDGFSSNLRICSMVVCSHQMAREPGRDRPRDFQRKKLNLKRTMGHNDLEASKAVTYRIRISATALGILALQFLCVERDQANTRSTAGRTRPWHRHNHLRRINVGTVSTLDSSSLLGLVIDTLVCFELPRHCRRQRGDTRQLSVLC